MFLGEGALKDWGAGVGLSQRVEEILWGKTLHIGWSVGTKGLGSSCVALAAALHLVQDDTGQDDEEDAAKGTAEGHQDGDTIGVVLRVTGVGVLVLGDEP